MAVWQFDCNIISEKSVDKRSHDEILSWNDIPQPNCNIDFLERKESWAKNIVQYGNIDETCIEFIYDENRLDEIRCRLDLRTLTKHLLSQIVMYVQSIDACFFCRREYISAENGSYENRYDAIEGISIL